MIPIADYPINIMLMQLEEPLILSGEDKMKLDIWHRFFQRDDRVLRRKYGLRKWATSSLSSSALCRTLAKIGHSYAASQLGIDGYTAIITEYIKGKEDGAGLKYVGGFPPCPATTALHEIALGIERKNHTTYVFVKIRLFASLGSPTYKVVVGTDPIPSAARIPAGA
jgi:hypothetical protein